MAKRRDILLTQAMDKQNKAVIATLRGVKTISISLGLPRRKTNAEGKIFKQVSILHCAARVAGYLPTIETDIEVETNEAMGVCAEMRSAVAPALAEFCEYVVSTYLAAMKKAEKPLDSEVPPPLPSMPRPPSKAASERGSLGVTSRKTRPIVSPPRQFDEADHADPEEGGES